MDRLPRSMACHLSAFMDLTKILIHLVLLKCMKVIPSKFVSALLGGVVDGIRIINKVFLMF